MPPYRTITSNEEPSLINLSLNSGALGYLLVRFGALLPFLNFYPFV